MSGSPQDPPPLPGQQPAAYPEDYGQTYYAPSTGMATTSLVLGIISIPTLCVCVGGPLGLVALILAVVALMRAGSDPERYGGRGLAIGGLVTGGLTVLLFVIGVITLAVSGDSIPGAMRDWMGVGRTAVNMENIGEALESYHGVHDEYPPDLAVLAESGMIAVNPVPGADDDLTGDVYYVAGLKGSDPPHWIMAYENTAVFGRRLVGVVYVGGGYDVIDQPEFAQALAATKKEYEQDRGQPPEIVEPPSPTSQAATPEDAAGSASAGENP